MKGLKEGLSLNDAGCTTLLHLLAEVEDTNLIKRGGLETAKEVQAQVADLLKDTPFPSKDTILELDREFIEKNLSPGGSADLLAITYFLYFLR
ncbi:triphosphoribosyl-dephospho-CoA synthase, partial [Paenibacillus sp.]